MVRTVWIQIYIYINILIIYLLTTYKLLHVYIKKKSQGMSDKVKDVINCSLYYTEFLLTHNWAALLTAEWAVLPVTVQQQYGPLYG
jgi:hypothetical protein